MGTEEAEKRGAVGEVEWDGEGDGVFGVRKIYLGGRMLGCYDQFGFLKMNIGVVDLRKHARD